MPIKNIVGERFGRLIVLSSSGKDKFGNYKWLCKCDCGNEIITKGIYLKKGETRSCGCLAKELQKQRHTTHNRCKEHLYKIWASMKSRCYNPHNKRYLNYGGRGITVCEEWKKDYMSFRKWAYANGYDENADFMKCTLDRTDTNGNYEPSNCRWVTMKEQANNKTNNRLLTYNGETLTASQWADKIGINRDTLWQRYKRNPNNLDLVIYNCSVKERRKQLKEKEILK
jgi:hypothetical protein